MGPTTPGRQQPVSAGASPLDRGPVPSAGTTASRTRAPASTTAPGSCRSTAVVSAGRKRRAMGVHSPPRPPRSVANSADGMPQREVRQDRRRGTCKCGRPGIERDHQERPAGLRLRHDRPVVDQHPGVAHGETARVEVDVGPSAVRPPRRGASPSPRRTSADPSSPPSSRPPSVLRSEPRTGNTTRADESRLAERARESPRAPLRPTVSGPETLGGTRTPNLLIRRRFRRVRLVVSSAVVAGQVGCAVQQVVPNPAP